MPPSTETRATIDDLYDVEGKAELIDGRIVPIMASGDHPSEIAFEIAVSLRDHVKRTGRGTARGDGLGYAVPELSSGRQSFEPDASYFDGERPRKRSRFIEGPPTFAVEVRSENDRGLASEIAMAAKRADYFEAGTLVVWDVDHVAELIHVYRKDDPTRATTFARGQVVDAEPAVPKWRIAVNDVFGPFEPA
jgi:Uma2 family endonuclease